MAARDVEPLAQERPVHAPRTLTEIFRIRLERDPDREIALTPEGRATTLRDVDALSDALAHRLRAVGVERSSVVGLYLWNDPSSLVSAFAVWKLGAVAALCGATSPAAEAKRRFELVGAEAVVAAAGIEAPDGWPVVAVDADGALSDGDPDAATRAPIPPLTPDPEDPACIFFTSGTTGDAKALVKSHGHLASAPEALLRSPRFRPEMADPAVPPMLSLYPFGQSASFTRLGFALYVGRALLLVQKFDAEIVGRLVERYAPKTLQLTPAMIHMLAHAEPELDLSSLRYVDSGTAPLPPTTRDLFEARYRVPILQSYGASEGGVTSRERLEDIQAGLRGPGSVGRILESCVWRIVDASGADVAPGEEGELLGRPDERAVVTADGASTLPVDEAGWYHTGDVGRVDEHGILYITGRLKEMLIVGGFNVFPTEIENALRTSPAVRDVVVVALPDERLGEVPAAGVVWAEAEPLERDRSIRFRDLEALTREQLSVYKAPRRWFELSEVPLTVNGKPDRQAATGMAKERARSIAELESVSGPAAERGTR